MTAEKLLSIIKLYREHLERMGLKGEDFTESNYKDLISGRHLCDHCLWMLKKMERTVQEKPEDLGKAFRWLGFVQGCFAALQLFSLKQLRDHSRSS